MKRFASEVPHRTRSMVLECSRRRNLLQMHGRSMFTKRCLICAVKQDVASCCRLWTSHFQENSQFDARDIRKTENACSIHVNGVRKRMTCCAKNTPLEAGLEAEEMSLFTKSRIVFNIHESLIAA